MYHNIEPTRPAVLFVNGFVYNTDREESHNSCHQSFLAAHRIDDLSKGRFTNTFAVSLIPGILIVTNTRSPLRGDGKSIKTAGCC